MKQGTFLSLFIKLEHLVQRLPEALQQPILREITPIKTLFLLQRAPRLVLVGDRSASKADFLNALFGDEALRKEEESLRDGFWQTFSRHGHGTMAVLDARRPVSLAAAEAALTTQSADLFLFLRRGTELDGEMAADIEHAARIVETAGRLPDSQPRVLGLQFGDEEKAREQLHAALHTRSEIDAKMIGTVAFNETPAGINRLVELLGAELPGEAQLEMARLSGNRVLQSQIAQVVIKSATAISGAVGAQPIPLADFPILTSLQAGLVAGIMHISGREMSARLAGEFIAAIGANFGAGVALREGARAAVKLVPLWGNAISGAVAAAGTYSIGRGAQAYFIEGVSIKDARRLFRKKTPPAPQLT
ncbi:MAG: hypothetical protein JWL90_507 [Chthoniobacteraceae bacterium]|nr:hypothetical protein [Chthoniobacteraceae bacterium]